MDKLEHYQTLIKKILTEYHDWVSGSPNLTEDNCLIFDDNHSHYIWMFLGWVNQKKMNHIQVHIRIKNEKIYIEEDWTEEGIATELLTLGVPKADIVLAFYPPEDRKFTEFAII